MATRTPPHPPVELKRFASRAEIERAAVLLSRRLEEMRSLDPGVTAFDDQEVRNIEHRVRDNILEIFGVNSPEYDRHRHFEIGPGPLGAVNRTREDAQRRFRPGIDRAVAVLEGLIKNLGEKAADFADDITSRVRDAFSQLDLHPRIAAVSAELFQDGHYRNAVLDASVALVNFVKEKSRRHDLDGAELMRTAFSKNNPILMFSDLQDRSAQDEQEGLMHLFEGAVLALRNPRAHELSPDSAEAALEFIAFLSLLAKRLERARRRKDI
jgi:uncharacterized protein (TIGR02391 family)